MPLFAIKTLPLNVSGLHKKVDNPMSTRSELGEFEIEADSIEEARGIAASRVNKDAPHMICPWREKTQSFVPASPRAFVHPTTLYTYNGKTFTESTEKCATDLPQSGKFLTKNAAKLHYNAHKKAADNKFKIALSHLKAINNLGVTVDYHMDGDTHGIHEDYLYLEVTEGPYTFTYILDR